MLTQIIEDMKDCAPMLASYLGGPLSGVFTYLLIQAFRVESLEDLKSEMNTLNGKDKLIEVESKIECPYTPSIEE